jgi:hypothetical protein
MAADERALRGPRRLRLTRSHAVLRLKRQLEQDSYPRIQMALIVALTGGSGLLCSFVLLRAGIDSMALRYPLALGGAYLVFLFLLWLWLRTSADDYHGDVPDPGDLLDLADAGSDVAGRAFSSGGGDFGGGGASGSFDTPGASLADSGALPSFSDATSGDADELAIPIIAVVLAVGMALASLYVVYLAPMLFAELLFDGALSYTLYRHLRSAETNHWLGTALRRTAVPFGLTAVFLVAVGAAMAAYAPGARSIGEVMQSGARR